MPLNVFLSYSHEDKRAKLTFQNNLTVMMKKKFITPWHDGRIEPGMRWREEIGENLERMDVFVGLLTTAFLASDFIETVEIKAARERLREKGREFLFVLILVDDVSLNGLDHAEYQVLAPGGKAVCKHASLRRGFDEAQKELEALIVKRQKAKREEPGIETFLERQTSRSQQAEGVTLIGKGGASDREETMSGESGELANCTSMIRQQAPGERRDLLETLEQEGRELIAKLPAGKRDEAAGNLELMVKAATSATPNRRWYNASAEGLLEDSKLAEGFSGNISGTIGSLGKLLWPDFSPPTNGDPR